MNPPEKPLPLPEWPVHRMTLRIYRVAPDTGQRTRVRSVTVFEQDPVMPAGLTLTNPAAYPPCACPVHRSGGADTAGFGGGA